MYNTELRVLWYARILLLLFDHYPIAVSLVALAAWRINLVGGPDPLLTGGYYS